MFPEIFLIPLILQARTIKSKKVSWGFKPITSVKVRRVDDVFSDSFQVLNPRIYLPTYSERLGNLDILINNWYEKKNTLYNLLENNFLKTFRFNLNKQEYEVLLSITEYCEPNLNTITIDVNTETTQVFYYNFLKHLEFSLYSLVKSIAYNSKTYKRIRKGLKDNDNESFIATEFKKHFLPKLDLIFKNEIKKKCKKKSNINDIENINKCLVNFTNVQFPSGYIKNVLESGEIDIKDNYEILINRCYEFFDQIYIFMRKKLYNKFPPAEFKITIKTIYGVKINITNVKRVAFYNDSFSRVELNPIDFILTDGKSFKKYIFIQTDVLENNKIRYVLEKDLIDIYNQKIIKRNF